MCVACGYGCSIWKNDNDNRYLRLEQTHPKLHNHVINNLGFKEANKISNYLHTTLDKETIILGPTMANMFKINNVYHYQIIIKYRTDDKLLDSLRFIDNMYKQNNKIEVEVDFNPIKI